MMYQSKMVCSLKTKDGKIIREQGDEVKLPFGTEYSIYLKNLESRKAKVRVWVDGEDVLDGNALLINPNSVLELEGFMKGNRAVNSFKFIEKTQEISEFRGDRIDDSLIRVEFWYEVLKPVTQEINYKYNWDNWDWKKTNLPSYPTVTYGSGLNTYQTTAKSINLNCQLSASRGLDTVSAQNCSLDCVSNPGITVKGSEVNQQFSTGYIGVLEENSHTIVLHLLGYKDNNEKVENIVTVNDKLQCKICGKVNKSNAKFCSNCGTFLE